MIYGYARGSTDGQSVAAQVQQLTKAGCTKIFREGLCCKLLPGCAKAAINGPDGLSGRFEFEPLAEKLCQ